MQRFQVFGEKKRFALMLCAILFLELWSSASGFVFAADVSENEDQTYRISGVKNENGWYREAVQIWAPEGYEISYSNEKTENNWSEYVVYDREGVHSDVEIYLKTKDGGEKEEITEAIPVEELKIDKSAPELNIEYENLTVGDVLEGFGFSQKPVTVIFHAKDTISGVSSVRYCCRNILTGESEWRKADELVWKADGTASFIIQVEPQFRGTILLQAEDQAGNSAQIAGNGTLVLDTVKPRVEVSYLPEENTSLTATVDRQTKEKTENVDENTQFIYNGAVQVQIAITEANFFDDSFITVKRDGTDVTDEILSEEAWRVDEENPDIHICTFALRQDGDYQVLADDTDQSGNEMIFSSNEYDRENEKSRTGEGMYCSNLITVDAARPEISVRCHPKAMTEGNIYQTEIDVEIEVEDHTFDPAGVSVEVEASDVQGNKIDTDVPELTAWEDWTPDPNNSRRRTARISFESDGRYQMKVQSRDLADHVSDIGGETFVIDREAPDTDRMHISYSDELTRWEAVLNAVTFGYYAYQKDLTVTLVCEDDISGIDSMDWTYTEEGKSAPKRSGKIGRTDIEFSENGKKATARFMLSARNKEQFRGSIAFSATDRAGNVSAVKTDYGRVNIVDSISPTRKAVYSSAKRKIGNTLYYDGEMTVVFKIKEANFYASDVDIRVNGQKDTSVTWTQEQEIWTGVLKFSREGEYVISLDYTDRSGNRMETYRSDRIVIDRTDPVIKVSYKDQEGRTQKDKTYFNTPRTAILTVTEHNFRASDVKAVVTARDITGQEIAVTDYARYLSRQENWINDGDTYTAVVTFEKDANYTFDISYQDLALRSASDYKKDKFTVDRTAPENLQISYRKGIFAKQIDGMRMEYYDAPIEVTVSAEDSVSGIRDFFYHCIEHSESGTSFSKGETVKTKVLQEGKRFQTTFLVPAQKWNSRDQFQGMIRVFARDHAKNESMTQNTGKVIVDTIDPAVKVIYNKPCRQEKKTAYYAENIEVSVEISETNFDPQKVSVSVSKDGKKAGTASVDWKKIGGNLQVGSFRLAKDGMYTITVSGTDASGNQMPAYTSGKLILDKKSPVLRMTGIQADSANKGKQIGFTVTAQDQNIDINTLRPTLSAVIQTKSGEYKVKKIPCKEIRKIDGKKCYAMSVENLPEDGIYTLSCSVRDKAGNLCKDMILEDGGQYRSVDFSVNRGGSAFRLGDSETQKLTRQRYVYRVEDDVRIEEINVDPVDSYIVRLNEETLTEGTDYETRSEQKPDTWCKRTYVIKKELFENEGEYQIVIQSVDSTKTAAYSDMKNLRVSCVVDRTPPSAAISGLSEGGRYQTDRQIVTVIPSDDGGKLKSFCARVFDKDGNIKKNKDGKAFGIELDNENSGDLDRYLEEHDGKITFAIPEGVNQKVMILCDDYALQSNGSSNTYEKTFSHITVSLHKIWFFQTGQTVFRIAGLALLSASATILAIRIRKRKKVCYED